MVFELQFLDWLQTLQTPILNEIMKAVMKKAGVDTKVQAIVFSLPVTGTAGLRLIEDSGE